MNTECKPEQLEFQSLGRREVIGRFDGGRITSDGGGLLLREVDQRIGLLDRLAACFTDHRNPESIEHSVRDLVAQRVYGLALGYEDLNDHDDLRKDSTLARCQPWRAKRRLVVPSSREAALLSRRALRQRENKVGLRTRRPVIGSQVRSSNELAKLLRSAW